MLKPKPSLQEDERLRRKREAVREGIAQAEAGQLIPAEDIKAWIDSWGRENELPPPGPRPHR